MFYHECVCRSVEEFDAIRRMNFPKDFIDFFEIAFRTGLHEKDILNLKKENITLVKDENNNIVSGRIYGNSIKFKTLQKFKVSCSN